MDQTNLPLPNQILSLQTQDMPHKNTVTELWNFNAYFYSLKDNQEFSITATLFQNSWENIHLYHTHSSFLDLTTKKYYYRSKGDRRVPTIMAHYLKNNDKNNYIQRVFAEVFQKDEYPLPDQKTASKPEINWKSMNYVMDDMTIYKDEENNYYIEVKFEEYYGFKLKFKLIKKNIINDKNIIIYDTKISCYSINRMEVTGTINIGKEVHPVEGLGCYNHKFGGTQKSLKFKENQDQSTWICIQLDNNCEIVYNSALIDYGNNKNKPQFNTLYISTEGKNKYYFGNLKITENWASMHSFIEYGIAWILSVEELDLKLYLKAAIPNQEIISIIAQPAYWKGSITVEGTYQGEVINGIGFVEQIGLGSKYLNYKNYLRAVSKQALKAVDRCYPLNPNFEDLRRLIVDEGFDIFLEGVSKKSVVENLIQPIRTITDRGGKAWRSMSLLLCIAAVGGDPNKFEDFLAFPELIHTASLIVDDVEDNSSIRRGAKTCHSIYGLSTAINAGTAAYFAPETLLKRAPISQENLLEIYQLYFLFLRGGHVGQGLDIQGLRHTIPECLETGDFQKLWDSLLAIHRLKSGLPASIAARMGVLLGEGTSEQKEILGEYFLAIGVAFQIMDDVINLQGFHSELKTKGEDLIEGKITAPVIQGFLALNSQNRLKLWQGIQKGASADDLPMLIELLEECGAIDICINYAKNLVENAWLKVDPIIPESYAKLQLRIFGWFVVDIRDY